ncbi:Hypothetical predicted protein, partial [Mytilus galloprovincialis]
MRRSEKGHLNNLAKMSDDKKRIRKDNETQAKTVNVHQTNILMKLDTTFYINISQDDTGEILICIFIIQLERLSSINIAREKVRSAQLSIISTIFDCSDLKSMGSPSGIYKIYPENVPNGVSVYCDMDKDGGGWIVIQNRFNGSVDFYRNWNEYKEGFGDLNTEFWLGNSYIHLITKLDTYLLRFDLEDADGNKGYAVYNKFKINDEDDDFRLTVSAYSGNLGDSSGFTYNNNAVFSTKDKGSSCPSGRKGGWWYKSCTWVNLNGFLLT